MNHSLHNYVVIAEDDPDALRLLTHQFTKAGYEVEACTDGLAALDAMKKLGGGLVVADWSMPGKSGLELCRALRGLIEMEAISFVYFILLSANDDPAEVVCGLQAGADDYVTKPYAIDELLARVYVGSRTLALHQQLKVFQVEANMVNAEFAALNERLEKLASTDELTGLLNRRRFFVQFELFWQQTQRYGHDLSCIMLDLDRFKKINDTFGHAAGDAVLIQTSKAVSSLLRGTDFIGRVGGEEFCIACPDTDTAGAAVLAERVRETLENLQIEFEGEAIPVSVSIGVAQAGESQKKLADLVAVADAMLYKAKHNGRNQVWLCDADGAASQSLQPAMTD